MTVARLSGGQCGSLEPLRDGFRRGLSAEGYAPKPIELHLALFSHVSRWLDERGMTPVDLTDAAVEEFFRERRRRYSWFTSPRALAPLLRHLASVGVVGEPIDPGPVSAVDELVEAYSGYLERDRGLTVGSIELYAVQVRRFVSTCWPGGEVVLGELDPAGIVGFVRRQGESLSTPSVKTMVCALRSFLRFLHATGRTEQPLADVVPSVADRRRATIPRHLPVEVVARLLATCDTATAMGRRDLAILRMLARLGLRAGEVAGLCLEDLDWRAGEVVIAGKGRRTERMPLPPNVGEAVVAYLREGRPGGGERGVFLGVDAPHRPLSRGGIKSVVYHACDRAGLERVGPHRLRHTLGTETLRAGASMAEVSQLLRHRRMETTAIYAKVDRAALETLARPWPTVSS